MYQYYIKHWYKDIKPKNPRVICLYFPDNTDFGKLNINGNITVNLINNCKKSTYLTFTGMNYIHPSILTLPYLQLHVNR